jgi:hypothetical protein
MDLLNSTVKYGCRNGRVLVTYDEIIEGYRTIAEVHDDKMLALKFTSRQQVAQNLRERESPLHVDCRIGAQLYAYLTGNKDMHLVFVPKSMIEAAVIDSLEQDQRLGHVQHNAELKAEYAAGLSDMNSQWLCCCTGTPATDDVTDSEHVGLTSEGFTVRTLQEWSEFYRDTLKKTLEPSREDRGLPPTIQNTLRGIAASTLQMQNAGVVYSRQSNMVTTIMPRIWETTEELR